jgi:hypothetical protein
MIIPYVISRIDKATSALDATFDVTFKTSLAFITTFCSPPTTTRLLPTGIGASFTI